MNLFFTWTIWGIEDINRQGHIVLPFFAKKCHKMAKLVFPNRLSLASYCVLSVVKKWAVKCYQIWLSENNPNILIKWQMSKNVKFDFMAYQHHNSAVPTFVRPHNDAFSISYFQTTIWTCIHLSISEERVSSQWFSPWIVKKCFHKTCFHGQVLSIFARMRLCSLTIKYIYNSTLA